MKNKTPVFPPPLDANKVRMLETEALLEYLRSNLNGLSKVDAQARLAYYGLNTIQEKHQSALLKFLSYFWGPIAWMIKIAAILSAIVHNTEELIIIRNYPLPLKILTSQSHLNSNQRINSFTCHCLQIT